MKKYIILVLCIILSITILDYLYFYKGNLFINSNSKIECVSKSDNENIYLLSDGNYEVFDLKGVNLKFTKPGHYSSEYKITKDEYINWFHEIQDLGANVIKIEDIGNPVFYEAFYEYNSSNPKKIYLIQGISENESKIKSKYAAIDQEFYSEYLKHCKNVIDIVHGRHKIRKDKELLPWKYKYDISQWVYGYSLGATWLSDFVVYTNESRPQLEQYNGEYISTSNANNFEIFLAKIMNQMIDYEVEKYSMQHSMTFENSLNTSPLNFNENIEFIKKKYGSIDIENINKEKSFEGALYVSYNIFSFDLDFILYEDNTNNTPYYELLHRLNEHHKKPVVISNIGNPSSRGVTYNEKDIIKYGNLSEIEQGQDIVSQYQDIIQTGTAGAIVKDWQDDWNSITWNTNKLVDLDNNVYWHDVQTPNQSFGILSFEPGSKKSLCYIDGNDKEWKDKEITKQNDYSISMKYDSEYLYFLVKKENLDIDHEHFFIPIDTIQQIGSKDCKNLNLKTSELSDFIIEINGKDQSRVWVNDRYDTNEFINGDLINRDFNIYENVPNKNSGNFHKIYSMLNNLEFYYVHRTHEVDRIEFKDFDFTGNIRNYTVNKTYETGKLTYGNANPKSPNFNSLADFCAGDGFVEIKIPWGLLNFADPTEMMIHDDYYENYGVEYIPIKSMNVGVGDGTSVIQMSPFELEKLGKEPKYHERLKESYYILQEYWNK